MSPQDQFWWKLSCETRPTTKADPIGCSGAKWPIRLAYNWMNWPLYSLARVAKCKWHTGEAIFCRRGNPLKGHRTQDSMLMAFLMAGATILFRRMIWETELAVSHSPRLVFPYLQSNNHLYHYHPKEQIPGSQLPT